MFGWVQSDPQNSFVFKYSNILLKWCIRTIICYLIGGFGSDFKCTPVSLIMEIDVLCTTR